MPTNSPPSQQQLDEINLLNFYGNAVDKEKNLQQLLVNQQNNGVNSSRYKTELCRPFEEFSICKYGDKCQFAHGLKELRSLNRHPKYKTELCRTFHTLGLCPYGHRCHFVHEEIHDINKLLVAAGDQNLLATLQQQQVLIQALQQQQRQLWTTTPSVPPTTPPLTTPPQAPPLYILDSSSSSMTSSSSGGSSPSQQQPHQHINRLPVFWNF